MTGNKVIYEDLLKITGSKLDWNAFSGKTVLITGANGFLPAYMVETLMFLQGQNVIKDVKVLALVRNLDKAKIRFKGYLDDCHLKFIVQDVCDELKIDEEIHFIIHAASQASPKYYKTDPVGTLSANVIGTINLLKLAQKKSIESFLYFSSSEVYGSLDESRIPTKETDFGYVDPTDIRSCYAESKRMGENICISWAHQFGVPVKIVRPFHTYGPGMALDDGRVYVDFVADILHESKIVMKSDGSAIRSFCYLSDATIAFFLVLLKGKTAEAYNVGNPLCEISILDLALMLVSIFPEKKIQLLRMESAPGYIRSKVLRNCPDSTKIAELGWFPEIDIKSGFFKTIKSYE